MLRLELGQAGDAVAVHVEREHAVGADEPVVGLAAGRQQDADALGVAGVLEEPLPADRVLPG